MESLASPWRIEANTVGKPSPPLSSDPLPPPQSSLSSPPTQPPLATNTTGYKPSLTVDVAAAEQEGSLHTVAAANLARTPHVATNIFVAGLPSSWSEEDLRAHYGGFGDILSTKVVRNKHFGFVMFRTPEAAHNAINSTHLSRPTPSCPTLLHVSIAMHDEGVDGEPNSRIFVRGLPQWATKEHLRLCFAPFGNVVECAVLMNPLGQCKGSGFVQFSSIEEATAAVGAKDSIRLDNCDSPLEVKFSEPVEVRQLRQERNRNRQKIYATSPKYRGNSMGNGALSPGATLPPSFDAAAVLNLNSPQFPFYPTQLPLLPSPQGYPIVNPMPFPLVYSPQATPQGVSAPPPPPPLAAAGIGVGAATVGSPSPPQRPTQIIYPRPVMAPLYGASGVTVPEPPQIPLRGDLHFSGKPVTEDLLRLLLQPFGTVDIMKALGEEDGGGFAVRMTNASQHPTIAQSLNGTMFATGDLLAAGLYA